MYDEAYFYKNYLEKSDVELINIVKDRNSYQENAIKAATKILEERKVEYKSIVEEKNKEVEVSEELEEYATAIRERIEMGEDIETIRLSLDKKHNPFDMLEKEIENTPSLKAKRNRVIVILIAIAAFMRLCVWLIKVFK